MSACITLALALATPTAEPPKLPQELVGTWVLTRTENNGEVTTPNAGDPKSRLTLAAAGKSTYTVGDVKIELTVTADTSVKPPLIDVTVGGPDNKQTLEGIWKVEGDTLTICVCPPEKKERPTEFKAGAGSGFLLFTLTRDQE